VTPLYPQKLALTSPTGGGRSVGIVRSRTKATELLLYIYNVRLLRVNPCVGLLAVMKVIASVGVFFTAPVIILRP